MIGAPLPLTRDIVLIGGGHTHALVLRMWGMSPLAGARLTLIDPSPKATYSGMLPGFVAGHYGRDDLDIDLVRLARFAGARLILGAVDGIDLVAREVHVPGRPPIGFDIASLDIGITSAMPDLPGFAEHGIPAKPLGRFAARWEAFRDEDGPARVVVIGAGVAGAELAMAMAYSLRGRDRNGGVTLVDHDRALAGTGAGARARLLAELSRQGVTLLENAKISLVGAEGVQLADGRTIEADLVTGAAGARPAGWLSQSGLDMDHGFVTVDSRLRSSDPEVFAVGDCAHMVRNPRPKAGVYAVRQAPVLLHNLRAAVTGGQMRAYQPQKDYLKLISLGQKSALAERLGLTLAGTWMWRWKDHIDTKFMRRFRELPVMAAPVLPTERTLGMAEALGDKPMCGGCGAKVGRATLRGALGPEPAPAREDITPLPGDDAALLTTGGVRQVMTSDHLRTFWGDWAVMTRVAAIHALGDIWAMGATPQVATATLILPRQSNRLQARMLAEIMTTAREVMGQAGAAIVGGHTSLGDELTVGFTLTGICRDRVVTLGGARAGDVVLLTKPIGSGVLMAAEMQGQADGDWIAAALGQMAQPQGAASRILVDHATAMTDVTGFGLAGHLMNICEASGASARLDLDAVPLMEGALDLATAGLRSSLFADNRASLPEMEHTPRADLLFDPQTAGGLLASVPEAEADTLLGALSAAGYPAVRIGVMREGPPRVVLT